MSNTLQVYVRKALDGKAYAIGILTCENMVFGDLTHLMMQGTKTATGELEISFKPSGTTFTSEDYFAEDIATMPLNNLLAEKIWTQSNHDFGGFAALRDNQKFDFESESMTRAIFISAFDYNSDILDGTDEALFYSITDNSISDNFQFTLAKQDMDYELLSSLDELDILRSPIWTLDNGQEYRLNHCLTNGQIQLLGKANREIISSEWNSYSISQKTRHELSLIGMDGCYSDEPFCAYVAVMARDCAAFMAMETRLLTESEHQEIETLGNEFYVNHSLGFEL